MKFRIKKDSHRAWPVMVGIKINPSWISKDVIFDRSCAYDLHPDDQADTNKLYGLAFLVWWRMIWVCVSWPVFALLGARRQHHHSARFGWHHDIDTEKIVLTAYCYVDGVRHIDDLCSVNFNQRYSTRISISKTHYTFFVFHADGHLITSKNIYVGHHPQFAYPCGVFFGGNRKAPQDMELTLIKTKHVLS